MRFNFDQRVRVTKCVERCESHVCVRLSEGRVGQRKDRLSVTPRPLYSLGMCGSVCECVCVCERARVRWRQAVSHVGEKYSILRAGGAVLGPVL